MFQTMFDCLQSSFLFMCCRHDYLFETIPDTQLVVGAALLQLAMTV